jgi:hypothetical protein
MIGSLAGMSVAAFVGAVLQSVIVLFGAALPPHDRLHSSFTVTTSDGSP